MERGVLPSTERIWKDLEENRLKDIGFFLWRLVMISHPLCPSQYHPTLLPGPPKPERTERRRKSISGRCLR
jgi:hypothetical protein